MYGVATFGDAAIVFSDKHKVKRMSLHNKQIETLVGTEVPGFRDGAQAQLTSRCTGSCV